MNSQHLANTLVFALIFSLGLFPCAPVLAAEPLKIVVVDSSRGEPYRTVRESMSAELQAHGLVPGVNLEVGYFSLGNFSGPARHIWQQAIDDGVDLFVVNGTIAAMAFKDLALGSSIPFFFAAVTDPVGIGIISAFSRPPSSNFTGISYPVKIDTRLRFIRRLMP